MQKPNTGCTFSTPTVFPSNWETGRKSLLKLVWRIDYYFFDPSYKEKYPNGKPIRIKGGINRQVTLEGRRQLLTDLLKNELDLLNFSGYNPITKTIVPPDEPDIIPGDIHPDMPLIDALNAAKEKKKWTHETKLNLKSVISFTTIAINQLGYDTLKISSVTRRHVKIILDQLEKVKKGSWSNNNYNHYRKHLSMLWCELEEYEAVEYNVVEKIKKRPTLQKLKEVLNDEQRSIIDKKLRKDHYHYWIFINLFFHSGTRRREICELKPSNINLIKQVYKTIVIKGGIHREVERPIKDIAVPFWEWALLRCKNDQYIFGAGFTPGETHVTPDHVTRKWKRVVKDELKINIGLYSLKHLNTDEITNELDINAAAKMNSHSVQVALKHYAVGEGQRQMDRIKRVGNTFSKADQ